jgi:hypothetical protein
MRWENLTACLNLGYEVNLSARGTTKRKRCIAVVVRYRKVAGANNVHPDQNIDAPMESNLRYPKHGAHHPVRETDINQVAGSD